MAPTWSARKAQLHAFAHVELSLTIERLMQTEVLEQDHGQEAWPGKAPREHIKGRRRLRNPLASSAGAPTYCTTFHCRGTTSSVSVTSSPRRGRWAGNGLRDGPLRGKAPTNALSF